MSFLAQGAAALLTAVAFWPWLSAAATAPRWAFLSIVVFTVLFFKHKTRMTSAHLLLFAFIGYAIVSLCWSLVTYDALNILWKFIVLAGVFVLGSQAKSFRPVLIGAAIGMMINSAIVIAQWRGIPVVPQIVPPAGLFMNRDMSSGAAVLVLLGLVGARLWIWVPGVLPSFVLSSSRGSLLAIAAVALVWLNRRFPRAAITLAITGATGIVFWYLVHADGSVDQRVSIWLDSIRGLHWLGNGIGSYYGTFPHFAVISNTLLERPDHAHNDVLELFYEFGVAAVLALVFAAAAYRGRLEAERFIFIGFAVQGLFSFPLYMPVTAALFFFAAGRLAGAGSSLRCDFARGRMALCEGLARCDRLRRSVVAARSSGPSVSAGLPNSERSGVSIDGVSS